MERFPYADAEVVAQGSRVFEAYSSKRFSGNFWEVYQARGDQLLRLIKLPQLLFDPERSVFIDDNPVFIQKAVAGGWPEERAILCPDGLNEAAASAVVGGVDRIVGKPN